jgi:hypothetical protein
MANLDDMVRRGSRQQRPRVEAAPIRHVSAAQQNPL